MLSIEPKFLKCAMSLHRLSLNRYVYLLNNIPYFMGDGKERFRLSIIFAYSEFINTCEERMAEIDPD